ncbi:ABC-type transport auxiliary lipoprotein family protein [Maridesulfovibrio zosterae]|uniref:ABC-type transport auxiliary lipoprotein family protein n=1 Tax=Maridesulfovibrio zosterae TaxID=82171 RepID=UPI00040F8065|nr:ABC-type transport auxiliary lipoprotein family protein [Maridesulfovibrio zosterae]
MRNKSFVKNKIIGSSIVCVIVLAMMGVSACVSLERPSLDRKYFALDVKRDKSGGSSVKSKNNLVVRRVKVSPRYEERDLVYKVAENTFESDYYNSFFIPPASLLTQELRLWMGDSTMFANVLAPSSMGTGDLLLEGVVNSIYGDYTGSKPVAVVNMQFFLLDNSNPDLPIIYSRNFEKNIPMKGSSPDALIQAMNKGVKEIFTELESDLATVVQKSVYKKELSPVSQEK